jgi:molybdate transport system substrate-binding protein
MQMQAVIGAGRVEAGTEALFVSNRLTVIVPVDNPANIGSLEDLAQPGVQLILAVEGVPVRLYADEIVAAMTADFQERFYSNLVSEEDNVRQVSAKVALGEADAGIVYTSDVTPDIAGQVQQIVIPDEQNVIAAYPIAPLADAVYPELAQSFIDFVLSAEGQSILSKWGFGPPPSD